MDLKQFERLKDDLNIIKKLIAIKIIEDKEYRDQVTLLHMAGLRIKEIAEITGKTENNVTVTLHLIKKSKKKTKSKKVKKDEEKTTK